MSPPLRTSALSIAAVALLSMAAPAAAATISASASPAEVRYGSTLTVGGQLQEGSAPLAGVALTLQADPYPYRGGYAPIAETASGPGGEYGFAGVRLGVNTRLRVVDAAGGQSAALQILVDPLVRLASTSLGPGRVRLTARISHPASLRSPPVQAWWYLAAHGSSRYRLVAVTTTRELTAGLTFAGATVDPPSSRFSFRVCLNPPWEDAMGPPRTHGPCPQHDFTLAGYAS